MCNRITHFSHHNYVGEKEFDRFSLRKSFLKTFLKSSVSRNLIFHLYNYLFCALKYIKPRNSNFILNIAHFILPIHISDPDLYTFIFMWFVIYDYLSNL